MPKNLKRGHLGSLNVFYKPKTSKKTQRGDPLVSPVLLEALKNLWLSARIEPTLSGLFEDEQI